MATVETVTVLITDLVGSTGLAARVGPVAADELRREHFATLRKAIDACSGHEVKNIGDGLMVVFPAASDAVACAVAIQQAVERRNRGAAEQLSIREGVALGDVTCEDGDYFGMPVVQAARLCDKASGGQILTTEVVRIIDGREEHAFASVGALELRGFPEAVSAYEVCWEQAGGWNADIPSPHRLRGVPPVGYVGRLEEHARATAAWDDACEGRRRVLLVSGEPGIGKTRFSTHAALEFHGEGAAVLYGHSDEEMGTPYAAWIQALSHLVEHAPEAALASYVERHGGDLQRLIPALARRVPDAPEPRQTDPETERYLLYSAVLGLLEQTSVESPVVLVLDDLHWADRPTLGLLRHVAAEAHGQRLLVLGTYRDSDLSRDHPLVDMLADMRREEGVERLALKGLAEHDVITLLEAAAGHEMDRVGEALAREITAETDGNPFFASELLRHLSESGALVHEPGGWRLLKGLDELGLPQSVREVIGRRVERLDQDCRSVLSCAAVIGRDFDLELLSRLVDRDEDALIELLEAAIEAALLQERADRGGAYSFAHNLINHTLYQDLGPTRRGRLHRRVAEALEDLCAGKPEMRVTELARHWGEATALADMHKALDYSRLAGEEALEKLAPDDAVPWLNQALELLERSGSPDPAERCELTIKLGEAQRQAGHPGYRETLLRAAAQARAIADGGRMARAALANSRGFASVFGTVDEERLAALELAIESDCEANPARCAELLALQAMELQFDPDHKRRRALADEALRRAREAGHQRVLPYVLRDHFHATWSADTLEARKRTAEEMRDLGDRLNDPLARIWALDRTIQVAAESGDLARAVDVCSVLLALTEELGQPLLRWHATYYSAGLIQMTADLDESERMVEAAKLLGDQAREPDTIVIEFAQLGTIRVEQGRTREIVDMLEQATTSNPGIQAFEAGYAAALCDVGGQEQAAVRLERAAARRFDDVPLNQVYSTTLALWARTAAEVRSEGAAALLYDLIEPWRDGMVWNGATGYGSAHAYLGMLAATMGAHDRAQQHFAAASALHAEQGVKGFEARNLYFRARSLMESGALDKARVSATRAIQLGRESGFEAVVGRAEALLEPAATP